MARSTWNGTVSLGLMNMPAHLVPLDKQNVDLIQKQKAVYEQEREKTSQSDPIGIRKIGGSQYFLSQACPTVLPAPEPHVLTLITAIPTDELNQVSFDQEYLVVPSTGATHAFVLFMDTLAKHKRVEIGTLEIRRHPSLCAIVPKDGVLHLYTFQTVENLQSVKSHISTTLLHLLEKFSRSQMSTKKAS